MPEPREVLRVGLDAHVVGRRQTGNETYIVNLAHALAERADVAPLAYVDPATAWPREPAVRMRHLRWQNPLIRVPVELPWRALRDRIDVLHVQYVAPPLSRTPVVTAIHDLSFEDLDDLFPGRMRIRLRTFVPQSARRSAAVVTISEFTRSRLIHHYGLEPSRVFVTPLAVDDEWKPMGAEEASVLLSDLSIPETFVLAVGNLHPRKNIPRLVRAVATLRAQGAGDLGLVLAGQRAWRAHDVDVAVAEVRGGDWVHFTGYVSDSQLRALYSTARVFAYPSLYEGFGLPLLEALACGAVVVASDTTAIPEVAGDAALLVSPVDDGALADGLSRALADDQLRLRLRAAGPTRAGQFTWERCAALTVQAYWAALRA